jgi:uncharacterized protein
MKKILIFLINTYQSVFSSLIKNVLGVNRMCRFSPTCSEYAKREISKNGIFLGLGKSTIRILRCQPFVNI